MRIEDQVIERLRRLPKEKQVDVLRFVERMDASADTASAPLSSAERAHASMQWIVENRTKYAGVWVALDGDRLVASGAEAKAVYDEARRAGVDGPFLHQVEEPGNDAFWSGWL